MKKLVVLGASAIAASTVGLLGAGLAASDPGSAQMNVIGQPYYKAVKILKGMGVGTGFGGSVGSDLPQQQCMVASQKVVGTGHNLKMLLNLDCTKEAAQQMADEGSSSDGPAGVPGGRQVGSNGVTTVQATPVGPQPGMSVPGS